jgi:tetratricopeptide (TPR) repeat protein
MSRRGDTRVEVLRLEAESLLQRARPREELLPVLERLVAAAPEGSDHALFGHRHLAELLVEAHPWRALLHLRRVTRVKAAEDDVVQALMGLCHALLGNYRMAIGHYRRALRASPRNPWYLHNVGHLLDVALAEPERALPHLQSAFEYEPLEDEIAASLAHCLACVGQLDDARARAAHAVRLAPRNRDHRALLAWIERGAPVGESPHASSTSGLSGRAAASAWKRGRTPELDGLAVLSFDADDELPSPSGRGRRGTPSSSGARPSRPPSSPRIRATPGPAPRTSSRASSSAPPPVASPLPRADAAARERLSPEADVRASWRAVDTLLERAMTSAGCPPRQRTLARSLWHDYFSLQHPRVNRPALFAAAVEYVLRNHHHETSVTQADIARRYEVSASALSQRAGLIRAALELWAGDPRYQR